MRPSNDAFLSASPHGTPDPKTRLTRPADYSDAIIVLLKWYAYAEWVLKRVEGFPKGQRFILGQRPSNHGRGVLETLVMTSNARDRNQLLIKAN